jgi:hypothetical protein
MSPDQLVDLFAKNKSNVSQFEFIEYFQGGVSCHSIENTHGG